MKLTNKSIMWGVFASLFVLLINFLVLFLLDFPLMATEIIKEYWIFLILLIGGFGVQVGLFIYNRNFLSKSTAIASGGISAFSMILCCSHYLVNVLPILGAFIGASFLMSLADYTIYFLVLGIVSNVLGIAVMIRQINKKGGFSNDK